MSERKRRSSTYKGRTTSGSTYRAASRRSRRFTFSLTRKVSSNTRTHSRGYWNAVSFNFLSSYGTIHSLSQKRELAKSIEGSWTDEYFTSSAPTTPQKARIHGTSIQDARTPRHLTTLDVTRPLVTIRPSRHKSLSHALSVVRFWFQALRS